MPRLKARKYELCESVEAITSACATRLQQLSTPTTALLAQHVILDTTDEESRPGHLESALGDALRVSPLSNEEKVRVLEGLLSEMSSVPSSHAE